MALKPYHQFDGSSLELARLINAIELEDLAVVTGIDYKRLVSIEISRVLPTVDEIELLAKATGVLPKFFNQLWVRDPDYIYNFRGKIAIKH